MKNIVSLKKVDLSKLNQFIDSLICLNDSSTIYFKLDKTRILSDAHDASGTIVKSISLDINKLCAENKINTDEIIKICFYDGNKVKKALSYITGNEINCEITYQDLEGEFCAESMKISSPKCSINMDAADLSLFDFANVPEDAIENVKSTVNKDCVFTINTSEILQIKKFADLDTNTEITISVSDKVTVGSENSYEMNLDENFTNTTSTKTTYKLDKKLFKMLDSQSYKVYPCGSENKIVFVSEDKTNTTVITLHEETEI